MIWNRWWRSAHLHFLFPCAHALLPYWAFQQHWTTTSPMNEWGFPINSGSALSCCKLVVFSHPQRPVLGFLLHPTDSKNKYFFHHVFTSLNHSQNQGAYPGSAGRRYQNTPNKFPGIKEKHSFAPHLFWWCPAVPSGSSPPLLEPCSLLEVLLPSSLPPAVPHQLPGVSETEQRDCGLFINVEMQNPPPPTPPPKNKTPYRCLNCGKEFYWGTALHPSFCSSAASGPREHLFILPPRTAVTVAMNTRLSLHHRLCPPLFTYDRVHLEDNSRDSFSSSGNNVHTDRHQLFCSEFAVFLCSQVVSDDSHQTFKKSSKWFNHYNTFFFWAGLTRFVYIGMTQWSPEET